MSLHVTELSVSNYNLSQLVTLSQPKIPHWVVVRAKGGGEGDSRTKYLYLSCLEEKQDKD